MKEELIIKTETYYALQKIRIQAQLRIKAFSAERKGQPRRLDDFRAGALHFWLDDNLLSKEQDIKKEIAGMLKTVPIWSEWLKSVKGIGPCLAGSLYAGILDIGRFPTVSHLWAYMGMDVRDGKAPKRTKGEKVDWNPFLRMTLYKITDSFIKQNAEKCLYRRLYDEKKAYYQKQHPEPIPGKGKEVTYGPLHLHNMAKRYAGKIFIQHLWVKWRELEGLAVSMPWVFEHGGHDIAGYIEA